MSIYIYLMTDYTHTKMHLGYCKSLPVMLSAYKEINEMSLNYPVANYLNRMIYVEEHADEDLGKLRFDEMVRSPLKGKLAIAKTVNPDLIELIPGVNFELK